MSSTLIVWPVLVQVLLTSFIYLHLLRVKRRAYAAGEVDRERVKLHPDAWPDSVVVVNNNLANQFHVPVLFYVVSLLLISLDAVDMMAVGAAWVFALSRLGHAAVHMTTNYVPHRMRLFALGLIMIVVMTALVAKELI